MLNVRGLVRPFRFLNRAELAVKFVAHVGDDLLDLAMIGVANEVADFCEIRDTPAYIFKRLVIRIGIRLEINLRFRITHFDYFVG